MKINLQDLIKEIRETNGRRAMSDEYLDARGLQKRADLEKVSEMCYGIVYVMSDIVLPFLERFEECVQSEFPEGKHWDNNFNLEIEL